ncbi:hypothetical protein A2V80_01655 [Candidatus Woesebacteria bacterium RBG_16_39_8b]|uniref:Uncharacterized protein n=1 Tax=Candidatus Woesebacteria bacterium RBG_16_39_8b TaxID=1802482 RepID=A0A1F7XCD9_9BACT|nr:MAG: hypothetical protein A2V80_01655 [Candidatus Woesebacteria bacterium RBG_16_39_8b]
MKETREAEMTSLSEARNFQKLITFRDIFKRLSQITWSVRTTEERFLVGTPDNEKALLDQYVFLGEKFISLANEFKNELSKFDEKTKGERL